MTSQGWKTGVSVGDDLFIQLKYVPGSGFFKFEDNTLQGAQFGEWGGGVDSLLPKWTSLILTRT